MSKKERKTKPKKRKPKKKRNLIGCLIAVSVGASLVVAVVFFTPKSEPWGLPAIPRNPRPSTLSPALFTGEAARAYQVAQEVPELLERMPCYCGCYVTPGHRNNPDCYTDRHGAGWKICIDITLDAYKMHKQGRKIEDIKKSIDARYSRYWPYEKKWPL